jgi:hypothetical protein
MGSLRREVMVPVPSYRRPSSLIGMSIVLVLLASAVDAVVWTYQAKRDAERGDAEINIPTMSHTDVAAVRARALEADLARAAEELRQLDEQTLERLRDIGGEPSLHTLIDRADREKNRLDDSLVTAPRCEAADPLCDLE